MRIVKAVCVVWAIVLAVALARPAAADLCPDCRGKSYVMAVGVCTSCGGPTTSSAFRLCPKCSAEQGKCEHCLAVLVAQQRPAQPDPLDLTRPGTHDSGKWSYVLEVTASGAAGNGTRGRLLYDGELLPDAELNDHYRTPWGMIYWIGNSKTAQGRHGWMPSPAEGVKREGTLLTPIAVRAAEIRLTAADNGKTVTALVGKTIVVTLDGNMTTGYGWQTAEVDGKAVESLGEPSYVTQQHPAGMVGTGGVFTLRFKAAQPGKATLRLVYVRPWEKDTPPAKSFSVTIDVKATASGEPEGSGSVGR